MEQSKSGVSKVPMKKTEKVGFEDTGSQLPMLGNDTSLSLTVHWPHRVVPWSCDANLREAWKCRITHRMVADTVP